VDIKPVPKLNSDSTQERANLRNKGKQNGSDPDSQKKDGPKLESTPEVSEASTTPVDSQIVDSAKVLELLSSKPTNSHTKAEFVRLAGKVAPNEHAGAKKLNKTL